MITEMIERLGLERKQFLMIAAGGGFLLVVFTWIFAFKPITDRVKILKKEIEATESDVKMARGLMSMYGQVKKDYPIIDKSGVSKAVVEISQVGEENQINFISIQPQEIEEVPQTAYSLLPVQVKLQAEYKNIGRFFENIRHLKQGLVAVRSFNIVEDEDILPELRVEIVLGVHLKSGENE